MSFPTKLGWHDICCYDCPLCACILKPYKGFGIIWNTSVTCSTISCPNSLHLLPTNSAKSHTSGHNLPNLAGSFIHQILCLMQSRSPARAIDQCLFLEALKDVNPRDKSRSVAPLLNQCHSKNALPLELNHCFEHTKAPINGNIMTQIKNGLQHVQQSFTWGYHNLEHQAQRGNPSFPPSQLKVKHLTNHNELYCIQCQKGGVY